MEYKIHKLLRYCALIYFHLKYIISLSITNGILLNCIYIIKLYNNLKIYKNTKIHDNIIKLINIFHKKYSDTSNQTIIQKNQKIINILKNNHLFSHNLFSIEK